MFTSFILLYLEGTHVHLFDITIFGEGSGEHVLTIVLEKCVRGH